MAKRGLRPEEIIRVLFGDFISSVGHLGLDGGWLAA
jgi:hypothetical protein